MRPPFCFALLVSAFSAGLAHAAEADAKRVPSASVSGDSVIRAPFGGSEIVITTTSRFAGAIHSLTWKGQEFINSTDHGRQLQTAAGFDVTRTHNSETFNPTEAGSRDDGAGPASTSRLLEIHAAGNELRTLSQMAFWLRPGERSGEKLAENSAPISEHRLAKQVRIGVPGLPNVLDYSVTYLVPDGESHVDAAFEALTGYMPPEFERFWHLNPATKKLEPLSDGPGEQRDPVVLSTADGSHAMGVIAPEPPPAGSVGPGYGRFRFVPQKVVKWNCVFRVRPDDHAVKSGEYRYHIFVPVGTLADVEAALVRLSQKDQSTP